MKRLVYIVIMLCVVGCGTKKPVLYPDTHLQAVGQDQAQFDINDCSAQADAYVKSGAGSQMANDAVVAGTVGGATGAAAGAVWGSAGKGAAAGAAAGVTAAVTRGLFRAKEPSPVYKGFVNRCLQEKGYSIIGWQ